MQSTHYYLQNHGKVMNEISVFPNTKTTKPDTVISIDNYVDNIRSGFWQDQVIDYRAGICNKDKIKAVTASGRFDTKRSADNLVKHSGYIAIDLDQKENEFNLIKIREQLYADEYVSIGHISLGGKGLVLFIKIETTKHLESFYAIEKYLADKYGIVCDKSCKDVSRLRFVSYDPDIYYNPDAKIWSHYIEKQKQEPVHYCHVFENRDIDFIIDQVRQTCTDLTGSYFDWMKIGFALANEYGENGRTYFHELSQFHPEYDYNDADAKYDHFLRTNSGKVHISSLFWLAKQAGIETKTETTKRIEVTAKVQKKLIGQDNCAKTPIEAKQNTLKLLKEYEGIEPKDAEKIVEQVFNMNEAETESDPVPLDIQVINYIKTLPLKYNQVTKRVEFNGNDITDRDLNSIFLNSKEIFKKAKFSRDYIGAILDSDRIASYHPFTQFFEDHKNVKRKDALVKTFTCFELSDEYTEQDGSLVASLLEKWLISIVASMHGTYSLLILVLVGEQATGKTKFFRSLLPDELYKYYAESKLDKGTDDELLLSQKLLIVDDEFGGKSKKEATKLKDLSSKDKITARKSYGRYAEDYQRYAVLGGTSNDPDIINDPTGNRRIIPVKVKNFYWEAFNKVDKVSLFMELYDKWKIVGDNWMLTREDIAKLKDYGEKFTENTIEEDVIVDNFTISEPNEGTFYTTTTMVNICEARLSKQRLGVKRFAQILKKLGYKRVKVNGIYGYWANQINTLGNLGNLW